MRDLQELETILGVFFFWRSSSVQCDGGVVFLRFIDRATPGSVARCNVLSYILAVDFATSSLKRTAMAVGENSLLARSLPAKPICFLVPGFR